MKDAMFMMCIRPDCRDVPRFCSFACAVEIEGASVETVVACDLLRRAAAVIVWHAAKDWSSLRPEDDDVLSRVGAFLAEQDAKR